MLHRNALPGLTTIPTSAPRLDLPVRHKPRSPPPPTCRCALNGQHLISVYGLLLLHPTQLGRLHLRSLSPATTAGSCAAGGAQSQQSRCETVRYWWRPGAAGHLSTQGEGRNVVGPHGQAIRDLLRSKFSSSAHWREDVPGRAMHAGMTRLGRIHRSWPLAPAVSKSTSKECRECGRCL